MKYLQQAMFTLAIFLLLACDNDPDTNTPTPTRITISELIDDSEGSVDRQEIYLFDEQWHLTLHTMTQTYGKYNPPSVIENQIDALYAGKEVTFTDSFGNRSVYTLNEQGYADSCTYQEGGVEQSRKYTFTYVVDSIGEYFLAEVTEYIDAQFQSQITFDELTAHNMQMTVKSIGMTNIFQLSLHTPNNSRLPLLALTDVHPLRLHQAAMYARLLGENPPFLLDRMDVVGSNEQTQYTYQNDHNGALKSCIETITSSGNIYQRTLYYQIEPAY